MNSFDAVLDGRLEDHIRAQFASTILGDKAVLKKIHVPGFGPYVFGRRQSNGGFVQPFSATPSKPIARGSIDHNAIRAAARALHPIYNAEENILANDIAGDCTCAGMLHIAAILQGIKGGLWRLPTAKDALLLYTKVTNPPYNIQTRANDSGADLVTVMDYVRTNGAYPDGTFKIGAPYAVDATKPDLIRAALDAHHCLYMGAALPDEWIPQREVPKVWDVAGPPNDKNGHCTIAYDYNDQGVQIDTWGCFLTVTWAALDAYYVNESGGELYAFDLVS